MAVGAGEVAVVAVGGAAATGAGATGDATAAGGAAAKGGAAVEGGAVAEGVLGLPAEGAPRVERTAGGGEFRRTRGRKE